MNNAPDTGHPSRLHNQCREEKQPPRPTHLIVVALGKEQRAQLPVERCLVRLLTVLGQFVHVRLSQLERFFSQVIFTVTVSNMQQP